MDLTLHQATMKRRKKKRRRMSLVRDELNIRIYNT
jgi:hypothetical protein